MTRFTRSLAAVSVGTAAVLLSACTTAPTPPTASAAATPQAVTVRFAAQINGQPFACGQSYAGVGTTRSTVTPSDYRFYVSDVSLVDETGRAVHAGRAANPLRSEFIAGFQISEAEIADVVAFLESLTDERFLSEPRHRSPWPPAAASAPTFQQPTKI